MGEEEGREKRGTWREGENRKGRRKGLKDGGKEIRVGRGRGRLEGRG